jgi:serine/threonine protein phosphatase PrpC
MRSTAVLLLIDRERRMAAWAHCGDTRLYLFRGGAIAVQTRDHSMVQEMVDARLVAEEDVRHHPRRNVLFSALGARDHLAIAGCEGSFNLLDRDVFLLCTDGLWEYVDEARMCESLALALTPAAWLDAMADHVRAMARANHDNFSAIAVWCNERP